MVEVRNDRNGKVVDYNDSKGIGAAALKGIVISTNNVMRKKEKKTVEDICSLDQISQSLYKWRDKFFRRMQKSLRQQLTGHSSYEAFVILITLPVWCRVSFLKTGKASQQSPLRSTV